MIEDFDGKNFDKKILTKKILTKEVRKRRVVRLFLRVMRRSFSFAYCLFAMFWLFSFHQNGFWKEECWIGSIWFRSIVQAIWVSWGRWGYAWSRQHESSKLQGYKSAAATAATAAVLYDRIETRLILSFCCVLRNDCDSRSKGAREACKGSILPSEREKRRQREKMRKHGTSTTMRPPACFTTFLRPAVELTDEQIFVTFKVVLLLSLWREICFFSHFLQKRYGPTD